MGVVVLHHGDWDGVTAAWVFQEAVRLGRVAGVERTETPTFHVARYDENPPHVEPDDDVWLLDFCYGAIALQHLLASARSVSVIDHHPTAIARVDEAGLRGSFATCVLCVEGSGCGLAWQLFFGDETTRTPALVRYVEDHDLWRFRLPGSRELRSWIHSFEPTLEAAARLHSVACSVPPNVAVPGTEFPEWAFRAGAAIERAVGGLASAMAGRAVAGSIDGSACVCANAPVLTSDVGHALLEAHPEAEVALVFSDGAKNRQYGLYSRPEGRDVSVIARKFGGGGHPHAAGFHGPEGAFACAFAGAR